MGLLWAAFEKSAAKKVPEPAQVAMVALPQAPGLHPPGEGWHPEWTPEPGWHSKENPDGWRKPARANQQKELFLWDQWKKSGEHPEYSAPLVKALGGIINKNGVQPWANRTPIHKDVLEAKALRLTLGGLHTYDPSKAQMNTHVITQLKSMHRFTQQRQNMTRITEERVRLIGPVDRAIERLREKLERDPTVLEIADEAKIPAETVSKLLQERRNDLIASNAMDDPFVDETPEARLKLQLIRYSLTPDEEKVFDYLTGQGGKPEIHSTGAIARREGWTDSKVSQLKKSIAKKWQASS